MIDLGKLRLFYIVAQEGSVSKASRKLNVVQSALSRQIMNFEHRLKTKLFHRGSQGMHLTPEGDRLFTYAKKVMMDNESFERIFYERDDEIRGELKIVTTPFVGTEWLVPTLHDFLDEHPDFEVRVVLRSDDLEVREGDVAIRTHIPHQPHLIQEPLFSARIGLFASPKYLEKFGMPQTPQDLNHHRLITYQGDYHSSYGSTNWALNLGADAEDLPRRSYFEINSLRGMLNCALQGYGIVELPDYDVVLQSGLQRVLPDAQGENIPLYYTFPKSRQASRKIQMLLTYLRTHTPCTGVVAV